MTVKELQQFEIMCDIASLIIASYNTSRLPFWLFKFAHPKQRYVKQIMNAIHSLRQSVAPHSLFERKIDELLLGLDYYRYYLTTHVVSQRLRSKVQNALIACFQFNDNLLQAYQKYLRQETNLAVFVTFLENNRDLQAFEDYYAAKHECYGIPIEELSKADLHIIAKSGLINGQLLNRFGVRAMLQRGLYYMRRELNRIITKKIACGFLNLSAAEGYCNKLDLLLEQLVDPEQKETILLQNARYLLENITNAAGVRQFGPAKYPQYAVLITSCYWVDELLQNAQAKIAVE